MQIFFINALGVHCRYREKLYFFSTEEAKDLFAADPMKFLAQSGTIAVHEF